MKYFYPLHIKSTINRINFYDSCVLRTISDEETADFFGIIIDERNEDGIVKKYKSIPGKGYLGIDFFTMMLSNRPLSLSANYVFETSNGRDDAELFNKALKILKPGQSGASIGFKNRTSVFEFIHPNPFYKKHPLYSLNSENLEDDRLEALYRKVKSMSKPKFNLISDKFLSALSGEQLSLESRFVDLMTILEILLLPSGDGELKYRLSLRIANMLAKNYNKDAGLVYNDFIRKTSKSSNTGGLYNIRSNIVHKGESVHLNDERFSQLEHYTRDMLNLYLDKPVEFTEDNLTGICLREKSPTT